MCLAQAVVTNSHRCSLTFLQFFRHFENFKSTTKFLNSLTRRANCVDTDKTVVVEQSDQALLCLSFCLHYQKCHFVHILGWFKLQHNFFHMKILELYS